MVIWEMGITVLELNIYSNHWDGKKNNENDFIDQKKLLEKKIYRKVQMRSPKNQSACRYFFEVRECVRHTVK